MCLDHAKTMLEILIQYDNCKIILTFNNNKKRAILSVCYLNKSFQITYLDSLMIESYNDINSTITAIDKAINKVY